MKLPPLNSLRAFVSAAKYKSFTKAAAELCVTQGAVSKQINILENYLGITLFERKHQTIELTKLGNIYLASISEVFNNIEKATIEITKKDNKQILNVSILPSLADKWIVSMLNYLAPHYTVNIEVGSGYEAVNFDNDLDVAIRIVEKGKNWKNCFVKNIIEEKMLCVCSPKYLVKNTIKNLDDLANGKLLNNSSRPLLWKNYFKILGLKNPQIKYEASFEHFFMLIEAAKDGVGLAMVPDFMVKKEIESGKLMSVTKEAFISGYFYQLIYPKHKAQLTKIEDFKKWATENLRKEIS